MGLSNVRFPAMPFIDDVADEVHDVDQPLRSLSEVQEELGFVKRPVASNGPTHFITFLFHVQLTRMGCSVIEDDIPEFCSIHLTSGWHVRW